MPIKIQVEETLKNFKEGFIRVNGANKKLKQALIGINGVNKVLWVGNPIELVWSKDLPEKMVSIQMDSLSRIYVFHNSSSTISRLSSSGIIDKTITSIPYSSVGIIDVNDNFYTVNTTGFDSTITKSNSNFVKQWDYIGLKQTSKIIVDNNGNVYAHHAPYNSSKHIYKISPSGTKLWQSPALASDYTTISKFTLDDTGDIYYTTTHSDSFAKASSVNGEILWSSTDCPATPYGLETDASKNLYVLFFNGVVRKYTTTGVQIWSITLPSISGRFHYSAIDSEGNFYAYNRGDNLLFKVDTNGNAVWSVDLGFVDGYCSGIIIRNDYLYFGYSHQTNNIFKVNKYKLN